MKFRMILALTSDHGHTNLVQPTIKCICFQVNDNPEPLEWLSTHPNNETRQIELSQLIPAALSIRSSCLCPRLPPITAAQMYYSRHPNKPSWPKQTASLIGPVLIILFGLNLSSVDYKISWKNFRVVLMEFLMISKNIKIMMRWCGTEIS